MTIQLNGETHEIREGSTIGDLLTLLNMQNEPVVTELDGQAVTQQEYASSVLLEGSRVEVIRLAAGG